METTSLQSGPKLWELLVATQNELERLLSDHSGLPDQIDNDLLIFDDARKAFGAAKLELQSGHASLVAIRKEWEAMSGRQKAESGTSAFESEGYALRNKTQNQVLPQLDEHLKRAQQHLLDASELTAKSARTAKRQAKSRAKAAQRTPATKAQPAASKPQAAPTQAKPAATSKPATATLAPDATPAATATPASAGKPRHTNKTPGEIRKPLLTTAMGVATLLGYDIEGMTDEDVLALLSDEQKKVFGQLPGNTKQRRAKHAIEVLKGISSQADGNNRTRRTAPVSQPTSSDEGGSTKQFVGKLTARFKAVSGKSADIDNEEQF